MLKTKGSFSHERDEYDRQPAADGALQIRVPGYDRPADIRMLTKYTVKRRHPETGKILDKLESYKLSDVIQYLAELYREEAQRDQQTEGLL